MGLKSAGVCGVEIFGIRVINEWLKSFSIIPVLKKSCVAFIISGPNIPQLALKKPGWKPSGPGAPQGFMLERVDQISSFVGIWVKSMFSESEMQGWMIS